MLTSTKGGAQQAINLWDTQTSSALDTHTYIGLRVCPQIHTRAYEKKKNIHTPPLSLYLSAFPASLGTASWPEHWENRFSNGISGYWQALSPSISSPLLTVSGWEMDWEEEQWRTRKCIRLRLQVGSQGGWWMSGKKASLWSQTESRDRGLYFV